MSIEISRVHSLDSIDIESVATLFLEIVKEGASLGFMPEMTLGESKSYWQAKLSGLGLELVMFLAREDNVLVGYVLLDRNPMPNGRHRADVQKMLVKSSHRGRYIARSLLVELESWAQQIGITLLILDTETGSGAETLYRNLGWQEIAKIEGYAYARDGELISTTLFRKDI